MSRELEDWLRQGGKVEKVPEQQPETKRNLGKERKVFRVTLGCGHTLEARSLSGAEVLKRDSKCLDCMTFDEKIERDRARKKLKS